MGFLKRLGAAVAAILISVAVTVCVLAVSLLGGILSFLGSVTLVVLAIAFLLYLWLTDGGPEDP